MSEGLHKHPKENNGLIVDAGEAHDEAKMKIEHAGREAAGRVQKGLFMSATKFAMLQGEAYKRAATAEKSNQEWHAAMDPPSFDEDDWDHGPDWR